MNAQRHYAPRVVPLELWDALSDDTPLYRLPEARQPAAIASIVEQLRCGVAKRLRATATLLGCV